MLKSYFLTAKVEFIIILNYPNSISFTASITMSESTILAFLLLAIIKLELHILLISLGMPLDAFIIVDFQIKPEKFHKLK